MNPEAICREPEAKAAPRAALTVFGGTDMPLGQALEGEYYKDGMNHGKVREKRWVTREK